MTIVAVLQKLGANEDLFALVFGESCLNDAVCFLAPRRPLPMCCALDALAYCIGETLRPRELGTTQNNHTGSRDAEPPRV